MATTSNQVTILAYLNWKNVQINGPAPIMPSCKLFPPQDPGWALYKTQFRQKFSSEAPNGFALDKIINLHHGLQSLTSFNLTSLPTAVLVHAALGTQGVSGCPVLPCEGLTCSCYRAFARAVPCAQTLFPEMLARLSSTSWRSLLKSPFIRTAIPDYPI